MILKTQLPFQRLDFCLSRCLHCVRHVLTHCESAVREVGHDEDDVVSVSYTRQERNHIVSTTVTNIHVHVYLLQT